MNETTPPIMTINDELLAEIEAAASAATPQDLDSAEEAIKADPGAMIECPVCGGEGYASVENDYCNFDNHAIGVQFYGIGPEFGAAERYYRRANPATIKALLAHIVDLKRQLAEAEEGSGVMRLIALIGSIRMASGDEGRHMQDELPGFIGELRRDAERYRWLREKHDEVEGDVWVSAWNSKELCWESLDASCRPEYDGDFDLDAAIDAARSSAD